MTDPALPAWGHDPLSAFLSDAQRNERVTALTLPDVYALLQRLYAAFAQVASITESEDTANLLPTRFLSAGLAIYDTVQYVKPDVRTPCVGLAASAAALLLAAGTPGKRLALPNARIMIHQPWGKIGQGQAVDLGIQAREFLRTKRLMEEILAKHTGQSIERVHQDTDRDYYMAPEEARAYGMIDGICARIKTVPPSSANGSHRSTAS